MNLEHLVHEYAALQSSLIRALREAHPLVADWASVIDLPSRGHVEAAGESWRFSRHGVGVRFTGARTARVIDAHRYLSCPTAVDAWRLSQYCEAIGLAQVNYAQQAFTALEERSLAECLRSFAREGGLQEHADRRELWLPLFPVS